MSQTKRNLQRVTITGADDTTSIPWMMGLSARYPFLEWGILISQSRTATPRFPSRDWILDLVEAAERNPGILDLCMHLCGHSVRQLLMGVLDWSELPNGLLGVCQRVQINTHAEHVPSSVDMAQNILQVQEQRQFIFQWDGVNDHLSLAMKAMGVNAAALFDTSGGAGRLPRSWPKPSPLLPCGYAGGLGPDNVADQVAAIEALCSVPFWIDMESRARTEDDRMLDQAAVETVLDRTWNLVATPDE